VRGNLRLLRGGGKAKDDLAAQALAPGAAGRPGAEATALLMTESTEPAVRDDRMAQARLARLKGYEGDPCPSCANFTLVRSGTCLKCDTCGSTTGCS
jgi:ribonucleoside-diphosphate reductase alpha chain